MRLRASWIFRKKYVTNKPFFLWFLKVMLLNGALMGSALGAVFWWYHRQLLLTLSRHGWLANSLIREEVSSFSSTLFWLVTGTILFLVIVFAVLAAFLSHQIAGPIHHLRTHMNSLLSGNSPGELRFRKGDHFNELIEPFNQLVRKVSLDKTK